LQNQRTRWGEQNRPFLERLIKQGMGKFGKWSKRVNIMQNMCTHECKQKKRQLLKFLNGEKEIKNVGGGKFKYDIFDMLLEPL
jgi:abortive infection bacteriophage resistance protein